MYKRIELQLFLISLAVADLALNVLILSCSLSEKEINMAYGFFCVVIALPHTCPAAQASPRDVI